ncbi:hypothetical protein PVAP13_5NG374081 [Panicum virgatum]|uniref:Uncharacterized protein n=1 Tax=Panicum virgatum TaxID=38727 RepID=A0A8T0RW16_PANVG|nr:hypothetical protein PVAP13_5NG374081 [Panicum virgatum]
MPVGQQPQLALRRDVSPASSPAAAPPRLAAPASDGIAARPPSAGQRRHHTPSLLHTARRSRERGGDNRSGGGRTGSACSRPDSRRCGSCLPPGHGRRRRSALALEAPTGRFAPPSPSSPAAGLPGAHSGDGDGGGRWRRGLGAAA